MLIYTSLELVWIKFEGGLKVVSWNKHFYCRHDLKWFEARFEGKFDQCGHTLTIVTNASRLQKGFFVDVFFCLFHRIWTVIEQFPVCFLPLVDFHVMFPFKSLYCNPMSWIHLQDVYVCVRQTFMSSVHCVFSNLNITVIFRRCFIHYDFILQYLFCYFQLYFKHYQKVSWYI